MDLRLLADVDEAYGQMSGLAMREVLRLFATEYRDATGIGTSHVPRLAREWPS